MKAIDRCVRCLIIAKSWYGRKFEDLVKLKAKSEKFRVQWREAEAAFEAEVRPLFGAGNPLVVDACKRAGMRLEYALWFLLEPEFLETFRFEPKVFGLKFLTLQDEGDRETEGIVLKPSFRFHLHRFRVLIMYSEQYRILAETVTDSSRMLRNDEPTETFTRLNQVTLAHTNLGHDRCWK